MQSLAERAAHVVLLLVSLCDLRHFDKGNAEESHE